MSKNTSREQLLQKNHKNWSQPKDFNKNIDTPNTSPPQAKMAYHRPKLNSVWFEYPYDHINPMENTQEDINPIEPQEQNIEYAEVEQE